MLNRAGVAGYLRISRLDGFDDRQRALSRDDSRQPEPGTAEQARKLGLRPLTTARREHQHFQIEQFAVMRRAAGWDDRVHDQHLAACAERAVARLKDPRG